MILFIFYQHLSLVLIFLTNLDNINITDFNYQIEKEDYNGHVFALFPSNSNDSKSKKIKNVGENVHKIENLKILKNLGKRIENIFFYNQIKSKVKDEGFFIKYTNGSVCDSDVSNSFIN